MYSCVNGVFPGSYNYKKICVFPWVFSQGWRNPALTQNSLVHVSVLSLIQRGLTGVSKFASSWKNF